MAKMVQKANHVSKESSKLETSRNVERGNWGTQGVAKPWENPGESHENWKLDGFFMNFEGKIWLEDAESTNHVGPNMDTADMLQ